MEFFSNLLSPIESLLQFVLGGLYNVNSMFGLVSYGYAIILLTIIVKFLLYPLTVKQVKSMKAMQEIAPKMKKIQEKYKDNPQVMQQKVAALYQEAGVNPNTMQRALTELERAGICCEVLRSEPLRMSGI